MKKRLFIAIQYLEIGGAERSLIGLLNAIDYTRYEVDLFVYDHRGEFMPLIPKERLAILVEILSNHSLKWTFIFEMVWNQKIHCITTKIDKYQNTS